MTQKGFEDYVFAVYNSKNGTAKSYITAIRIVDQMFEYCDVFGLNGQSILTIEDSFLLTRIVNFVCSQQSLFIKGEDSIFRNIAPNQVSYPGKRFCSAAVKQLMNYYRQDVEEKKADTIVRNLSAGAKVSDELCQFFKINKEGKDVEVKKRERLGQNYFRKMVLLNYDNRCCITGINVPQLLRASHIVAWADDKKNRMNPENGLCLSATYDAAFDKHLITFDENYRMIVSRLIKDYYSNEVVKDYFGNYEGKKIMLPIRFMPSQKMLSKHRELFVG